MKWTTGCGAALGIFVVLVAGCIGIGKINDASASQSIRRSLSIHSVAPLTISPTVNSLPWATIQPGVEWTEVYRAGGQGADKVWLYRPSGKTAKLPCVVIAPAGSRLFHGMLLSEGDVDEHLPYVRAGYAVVAYELAGPLNDNDEGQVVIDGAKKFSDAGGGVKDTQAALDIAEQLPWVNSKRIFLAGHSSAGTAALAAAAFSSKRIAGCIAYAPGVNIPKHLGPILGTLDAIGAKGLKNTLNAVSPHNNTEQITCPLFLFGATDDTTINVKDVQAFASTMRKTNKDVTFESVPQGGHYDSMIQSGIPAGIRWMNTKK